ncbi:Sodium-and chloride-dependent GABA transporter ine [Aphelenchoides besseyi]|nr:Sodium-and chloride-dependent GABA transporter ine [Aphelenchoides besseyi]
MWFEERSLSNLKMSSLIVEEFRDLWSFKVEFLIVSLSYVFATTNFLNLGRLVFENGGLAFLSAYGVSLLVVALPLIVLELSVGQLTGRSTVQSFYNVCPSFKGIGVSQVLLSLTTMALMSRYLSWIFLFIFHLFWTVIDERPGLPWINCENFPELQTMPCIESFAIINASSSIGGDQVRLATLTSNSALSQFLRALEHPSTSIAEIGHFQFHLLIALGIVYALVFFAICFGVRWLGKVVVFTFVTPVCLLLILLTRVLFLSGAIPMFEKVYLITNWEKLADYMVWKVAVEQAILATGVGFGVFITIASYNKRSSNLVRDSFVIVFGHAVLTVLQLAVVFAIVGFVSWKTDLQPLEILGSGENQLYQLLTYLSYIPSVKLFTGILLFALAFIVLNIVYLLALNVLATIEDAAGSFASKCCPRFTISFFLCVFACASGIFFTTQAGRFAYELAAGFLKYATLWVVLAFEILAVTWFYCAHSLGKDLKSMLKNKCCWCFGHSILLVTYLLIVIPIGIAVLNLMEYNFGSYSEQVRNWPWSEYVGWAIAVVPLLPIVMFLLYSICYNLSEDSDISRAQKFRYAFRSPMRYEIMKNSTTLPEGNSSTQPRISTDVSPRFNTSAPGYTLLPQNEAPLAEPENYNDVYTTNNVREIPIRRV